MIIDPKGAASLATQQGSRANQRENTKVEAKQPEQTTSPKNESVELSREAKSLQKLEANIEQAPIVNEERVAALKAAIADGSYQIDAQKLSENILRSEDL